ncbi:MAG: heme ABC exporter ATP-binding protein CcmA [Chloroflexi bacterium]|nr:heme ABC exporter ATP-binding protein CcmA [Chloroflexota bacterium]
MSHPAPIIEARGLTKRFGGIVALQDLNLAVAPGLTYGLLGPNGSGKTTLIRILVGLLFPTSGRAWVLGRAMPDRSIASQIGYMTQAEALYQELTVRENLTFFARIYGVAEGCSRVEALLELVDLRERADSPVHTLSGGMKRRASLACALVHHPPLLLLDEPTVGIDPQLRAIFWEHFRSLNQEGVTIIISTHVMDEAERCHRLGLLLGGRLLAEGSAAELKARTGAATVEEAFLRFEGGTP